jgi:hypothetical protein
MHRVFTMLRHLHFLFYSFPKQTRTKNVTKYKNETVRQIGRETDSPPGTLLSIGVSAMFSARSMYLSVSDAPPSVRSFDIKL